MSYNARIAAFVFLYCLISLVYCDMEESDVNPDELPEGMDKDKVPPGLKKFSFKAPKLSEEDQESMFFSASLMCDGCKAVTFKLHTKLKSLYDLYKNVKGGVKESILLDGFDKVCSEKNEEYAVKEVGGRLRMVGPGLKNREDEPGIIQGGGRIPGRMIQLCHSLRGEIGEDDIYQHFLKDVDSKIHFEKFLCNNKEFDVSQSCLSKDLPKDEL